MDGMDQGKTHLPHCVKKSKVYTSELHLKELSWVVFIYLGCHC